jgi:DNA-3-methyladenine glycosylase II
MPQDDKLTPLVFDEALDQLAGCDPDLDAIITAHGPPPMWSREPGFATLIHIILEQQVSLASAQAAYDKLVLQVSDLTPARFLALDDRTLRMIGFSRQKTRYCRILASAVTDGTLPLRDLEDIPEHQAREKLLALTGIGRWTADVYLLMALGRPDIWPVGDLALAIALQDVKGLKARPKSDQMETLAEPWKPWRAVAARILWHHYLSARAANPTG